MEKFFINYIKKLNKINQHCNHVTKLLNIKHVHIVNKNRDENMI